MSRSEKVALVTGASRRLGKATAIMLHKNGYKVIIHYHNSRQAAEALCEELNLARQGSAASIGAALDSPAGANKLAEEALATWQQINVLVNNASSFYPTPVGSITGEQWNDLMASNAMAPLFLSQALFPELEKNSGCIINMADIHAQSPLASHTVYCMAKAALAMMTRSLAVELAPAVRVNGISPGAILWPDSSSQQDEADKQAILDRIPLEKTGTEQDIANTVLFLCQSSYITGQIIAVDGGRSL